MSDFKLYFEEGWKHIVSTDATDHILFIVALGAVYQIRYWKQVFILVTAFTVGHSLTLALSAYDIIRFNSQWVEFLIPCTIALTALYNILHTKHERFGFNYFLALFFGLIHGMGFANTIRFMLASDQQIALPLFSFNLGLEAGQILLVILLLLLHYVLVGKVVSRHKIWVYTLSVVTLVWGAWLAINRIP